MSNNKGSDLAGEIIRLNSEKKIRKCLRCDRPFNTTRINRICGNCTPVNENMPDTGSYGVYRAFSSDGYGNKQKR